MGIVSKTISEGKEGKQIAYTLKYLTLIGGLFP